MFTPIAKYQYTPPSGEGVFRRFDDEVVPSLEFSDDVDHTGHVKLTKARYGWRCLIDTSRVRVIQRFDLCRPLIDPLDLEELGTKEPVQEPRKPVLAFWRRSKSERVPWANLEHEL